MNTQTYEYRSQCALERQMKKQRQMQKRTGTPDLRLTKQILRYRLVDILVNRKRTQIQTEVSLHDVEDLDIFEQMYNKRYVERQILDEERAVVVKAANRVSDLVDQVNEKVDIVTGASCGLANNANRMMDSASGVIEKIGTATEKATSILETLENAMSSMQLMWDTVNHPPFDEIGQSSR